jgi:hypothetical protein
LNFGHFGSTGILPVSLIFGHGQDARVTFAGDTFPPEYRCIARPDPDAGFHPQI